MYMPRDLNYEPLYAVVAVATFLSPLQSVQRFEWAWEEDRQQLPQEVQKLEDYMGEEAMQTNDNIRGVEDHEEVYIPGVT